MSHVTVGRRAVGLCVIALSVATGICYGLALVGALDRLDAAALGRLPALVPLFEVAAYYIIGSTVLVGGILVGAAVYRGEVL